MVVCPGVVRLWESKGDVDGVSRGNPKLLSAFNLRFGVSVCKGI